MKRWICDIDGKWVEVNFDGPLGVDGYGNEYMFKDCATIYEGFWDDGECAFQVSNEYTSHMERSEE